MGVTPPPVITLQAANTISDVWDFEGTVTDNGNPVAGLTVRFGGVLANCGLTATVQANGTYSTTQIMPDLATGTATAQTQDVAGQASNVAMTYVEGRDAGPGQDMLSTFSLSSGEKGRGATIATVAGNGTGGYSGDGQTAAAAQLYNPLGIAADAAGDLFIADSGNNAVREVSLPTGTITTIAGNYGLGGGYSGDGQTATAAQLDVPTGIATDAAGDLFIADSGNNVVREVNLSTGVISTVAGSGSWGYSGDDSAATSAQLNAPTTIATDAAGDLFIADSGNNVVREVNHSTGVITTVAGNFALGSGYSGDGSAATSAQLNDPTGVAVDAAGDLFIADSGNNVVREVNHSTGVITTVAGNFALGSGYSGDGSAATSAQLNDPTGVTVDAAGDLFIADSGNNVVREVNHSTGMITTVAGNYGSGSGYSGDGSAAAGAQLDSPASIVASSAGDVFIADTYNDVVRKVAPPLYWDPNQKSSETSGGSGVWTGNSNDACWYNPFLAADAGWSDGSDAVFSGAGGTVTLSGTISPASISFEADGYILLNATRNDGLIAAQRSFHQRGCGPGDGRLLHPGPGSLTVVGSGTLALGDANAYGQTDLEEGTLQLGNGATLGSSGLIVDGGVFDLNGNSIAVASLSGSGGTITNSNPSPSTLTIDQGGGMLYSGEIQTATAQCRSL